METGTIINIIMIISCIIIGVLFAMFASLTNIVHLLLPIPIGLVVHYIYEKAWKHYSVDQPN